MRVDNNAYAKVCQERDDLFSKVNQLSYELDKSRFDHVTKIQALESQLAELAAVNLMQREILEHISNKPIYGESTAEYMQAKSKQALKPLPHAAKELQVLRELAEAAKGWLTAIMPDKEGNFDECLDMQFKLENAVKDLDALKGRRKNE